MGHICFLSMDSLEGYVADDDLTIAPLKSLGWDVETLSWRASNVDWDDYDAVIIRTTWDYQRDPKIFLETLGSIDASRARLFNPLDVVRWNLDKRYLRDIGSRGIPVVPTIWDARYESDALGRWLDELKCDEVIVKPTVSSTAEHTYRLRDFDAALIDIFSTREFLVQPFMPNIVAEGEYSLFYFASEYSHAILKSPKTADFRVQEEHGGDISATRPGNRLLTAGRRVVSILPETLLYARVDFVRDADDNFALMELELIEPSLYFRMDEGSPDGFARAFDRMIKRPA